ncbi:methyl-accepting chemotaxis protein [Piscinibacterium candidicorallinum]|uniref:Methyl-accepting chemotaxis protein n=2 Tax=Piscinibacterium candidicorallinum TaxID=1793872 RepID=A0ABV7GWN0_9BURK
MQTRSSLKVSHKLFASFGLMFTALVAVAVVAFVVFSQLQATAARVSERLVPQIDRISEVQILMFRISLEARHAMLVKTPEERTETMNRIGEFRKEMLSKLETFESQITTTEGRERFKRIRNADVAFWQLAGQVAGKIQSGDIDGAFEQLKTDLVPARDAMVKAIAEQREYQQALAAKATREASETAKAYKLIIAVIAVLASAIALSLAISVTRMVRGALRRARTVTDRIAKGDLQSDIWVRPGDEFGHLFESISEMQSRLAGVVGQVNHVAQQIVRTAEAIDSVNSELSDVSQEQTRSVQASDESTRRITAAVHSSGESTAQVSNLARQASTVASEGGSVVGQVVGTMHEIDESSKRIAEIVNVIDGIAFQTNILALNAAVEAARAGEQGRGFAVVAGEVRTLAQRSAKAATEVKQLIDESVNRVRTGSALVDQAGRSITDVVSAVEKVSALAGQIADATRAQRADASAVEAAVSQISQANQRGSHVATRSNKAAAELREQAQALERAVAAFTLEIGLQAEASRLSISTER